MKLLTFNMHSRPERGEALLQPFGALLAREQPDVIALQEVNQSMCAAPLLSDALAFLGGVPLPDGAPSLPIKKDNVALMLARMLWERGLDYHWLWLPVKCGYRCYDEGVALLMRRRPEAIVMPWLSLTTDAGNWRTRRALGALCDGAWFYSVHTGRWDDRQEPFSQQWRRLQQACAAHVQPTFLLGDFNCPAKERGGGYDRMLQDGWHDMHTAAQSRRGDATAHASIDGWQDESHSLPMRIDYILADRPCRVLRSVTLMDGGDGEVISDHFALLAELQPEWEVRENG